MRVAFLQRSLLGSKVRLWGFWGIFTLAFSGCFHFQAFAEVNLIGVGWHLAAPGQNTTLAETFTASPTLQSIWAWSGNSWTVRFRTPPANNPHPILHELKASQGYWFQTTGSASIPGTGSSCGTTLECYGVRFTGGWHLLGTAQAVADLAPFTAGFGSDASVWSYRQGQWWVYSPGDTEQNRVNQVYGSSFGNLRHLEVAEGFWLHVGSLPMPYLAASSTYEEVWIDPVSGNDQNTGVSRSTALKTINAAWNRLPLLSTRSQGYRMRLTPGVFRSEDVPVYWESRYGTYQAPILLEASDGAGTVLLPSLNLFDVRYFYLSQVTIQGGGGDIFHCEKCDHLWLKEVTIIGASPSTFAVQETVKINQSQHIYIESSDISGAWDNAIDFVGVQYGHVYRSRVHQAGDWCMYAKGGSAYLKIESNRFYDCGNGGFTAGQGTGFEFMTSPWLHYEAYDIRVINNLIYETTGAGLGVNGGFNILMAHNTLYRVGQRSHVLEVVFGLRSCDGNTSQCQSYLNAQGWGIATVGTEVPIPNRHVFLYNNLVYNPGTYQSQWQHFTIDGPRVASTTSNIASPAQTDVDLQIRGNVIWNGQANHALGLGATTGCLSTNPICNASQLQSENAINTLEPQLQSPATGDFRPAAGSNLFERATYHPPKFLWHDAPTTPALPIGLAEHDWSLDAAGSSRGLNAPPGAFATSP